MKKLPLAYGTIPIQINESFVNDAFVDYCWKGLVSLIQSRKVKSNLEVLLYGKV